jgi:carbonic anhydrase/acetyltransferase-like protein (isoleucine patch superfamily)
MEYRKLTTQEIETLRQQGCLAESWSDVIVRNGFTCNNIHQVRFSGQIRIGDLSGTVDSSGLKKACGIFNSSLNNCVIGDHVYISDVKNLINYHIEDNVVIENTGNLSVQGESTFGNGTEIEILNEGGGRELPIIDELTAQLAYMVVFYRHDQELIARLKSMIMQYAGTKRSASGTIGSYSRIYNTTAIYDVCIGPYTTISGASLLKDGTIASCREAPVYVGEGVMASHFVVLSGSKIVGGAFLEKCFIGQGVKIEKQYSGENCAFFANTEVGLGEGCSVFAGPYTISHHKSTLLIAAVYSFFNAGSGTNQSNHMYKLGPIHQGIMERGGKTGSLSYLLWPCRVGPFTAVVGKHFTNFDTGDFPFSYITEESGKSMLYPAMNLFTVGTRRDSEKWPTRDRRKDPDKKDIINFTLFNPFTAGRMAKAVKILGELAEKALKTQDSVSYQGIHIPRLLLKTTRKYYEMALKVYMGDELIRRIASLQGDISMKDIQRVLEPSGNTGRGAWLDLVGMLMPESEMEGLISELKSGKINSIPQLRHQLSAIHQQYDTLAWNWCSGLIQAEKGVEPAGMDAGMLAELIKEWQEQSLRLNNMIRKDAEKEFDQNSRIGYGSIGGDAYRAQDFEAVRGSYDRNKFVLSLQEEAVKIAETAGKYIDTLSRMR